MRRLERTIGIQMRLGLLALTLAAPSVAQQIDRTTRPQAQPRPPFKFPTVRRHALANGLYLLVVEDHSVPVVAVRAVVGTDSLWDPPSKEGVFAVTLGALREGTSKRSGDELARAAAAIGTDVAPVGFTTAASAFEPALDLMAEMLTQPAFDSSAIERRKVIHAAAARRIAQAPVTIPRHLFYELLYSDESPFVRSLVPTEASIASITRADVVHFYDTFFSPRSTTVAIVGDVTDSVAFAAVTRAFSGWQPRGQPPDIEMLGHLTSDKTKITVQDVPGAGTQAYIYVGRSGPSRRAPDVIAAEAFAAVASNRLQETLREKRSFMYSGAIGLTWHHGDGTFVGSTVVSARKADSALAEWLRILRELRTTRPPTAEELDAVRRNRVGVLPSRIDGPDSIVTRLVEIVREGLPLDYFERYAKAMSTVTPADLVAAGAHYVDLDRLAIVVTGDRSVLEPALRAANLAPVTVLNAARGSSP